jgi:hypothetical protein
MEGLNQYLGIYRGQVLLTDALEENKLGRIKVEVFPMLISEDTVKEFKLANIEGMKIEQIPWATPAMSLFAGAGDGFGSFVVPDIKSWVWLFFESGDIYQPVYFAEATNGIKGLPVERLVNYPYTKVFKTATDIVITINDSAENKDVKIVHPLGSSIQMDKDGNINIVAGDVNIIGKLNVTGIIKSDTEVQAKTIQLTTHVHGDPQGGKTAVPE